MFKKIRLMISFGFLMCLATSCATGGIKDTISDLESQGRALEAFDWAVYCIDNNTPGSTTWDYCVDVAKRHVEVFRNKRLEDYHKMMDEKSCGEFLSIYDGYLTQAVRLENVLGLSQNYFNELSLFYKACSCFDQIDRYPEPKYLASLETAQFNIGKNLWPYDQAYKVDYFVQLCDRDMSENLFYHIYRYGYSDGLSRYLTSVDSGVSGRRYTLLSRVVREKNVVFENPAVWTGYQQKVR